MAFRRRALAFDLAGVASFNVMNKYHQALAQRLQEAPASGYARVSVTQVSAPPKNPAKRVKKAPKKTNFAVSRELVGKLHQTPKGHRLCWGFNLPCGKDAKPGGKCAKDCTYVQNQDV